MVSKSIERIRIRNQNADSDPSERCGSGSKTLFATVQNVLYLVGTGTYVTVWRIRSFILKKLIHFPCLTENCYHIEKKSLDFLKR